MRTRLFLVRHAAHELVGKVLCGRMDGVHLSAAGHAAADALASRLSLESCTALYSSPLDRAVETGASIAAACKLPIEVAEDLNEVDFGAWTGQSFTALAGQEDWCFWNRARDLARAPGGESPLDVQHRVARFLLTAGQRHCGAGVIAVSHGDVIKAAIAHVLGLPAAQYGRFDVAIGSVSIIDAEGPRLHLHRLNEKPS